MGVWVGAQRLAPAAPPTVASAHLQPAATVCAERCARPRGRATRQYFCDSQNACAPRRSRAARSLPSISPPARASLARAAPQCSAEAVAREPRCTWRTRTSGSSRTRTSRRHTTLARGSRSRARLARVSRQQQPCRSVHGALGGHDRQRRECGRGGRRTFDAALHALRAADDGVALIE